MAAFSNRQIVESTADPQRRVATSRGDRRTPNFLYVGTSKAGSTWIFDVLARHPDVWVVPGKGLYFFDNHFDRGFDWYLDHFRLAGMQEVVAEVSHSYLFSLEACRRIAEFNPEVKLMVCLREPVERAFSDYLDRIKNGKFAGTFEQAIDNVPPIIERGRYAQYLQPYLEQFGRERIHIGVFDELQIDPARFANQIFAFLGLAPLEISATLAQKIMPAATPRSTLLTKLTKSASARAKRMGFKWLTGRLKRSRLVRGLLYRPYAPAERPSMQPETREMLRGMFREDVAKLDGLLGSDFALRWNYSC